MKIILDFENVYSQKYSKLKTDNTQFHDLLSNFQDLPPTSRGLPLKIAFTTVWNIQPYHMG